MINNRKLEKIIFRPSFYCDKLMELSVENLEMIPTYCKLKDFVSERDDNVKFERFYGFELDDPHGGFEWEISMNHVRFMGRSNNKVNYIAFNYDINNPYILDSISLVDNENNVIKLGDLVNLLNVTYDCDRNNMDCGLSNINISFVNGGYSDNIVVLSFKK